MASPGSQTDFETALDSRTPTDVLNDEALLASVHRFLQKGTALECSKLIPEEFRYDESFKRRKSLRAQVQAIQQPHRPWDTPTSPEKHFESLIPDKAKRLRRLVKVAQHIAEFRHQEIAGPDRVYDESSILNTPIARAEAIFKKMTMSTQDTKSYRYNLLYFSNAVDQYESMQLKVSQGRRNKSVAFDTISRGEKQKRETARRMYSDACRYLEYSEVGSPGSLLSINAAKSDIMENLSNEDIRLLCSYRKEFHGNLERQSRSLDFTVVKELVHDLLAQGIEKVEITKGLTRLTKPICQYLDTKSLAEDGKILPKPISVDSNEGRRASSQFLTGSGPAMDVRLPSYTMSPEQQGPIPTYHSLQSQQLYPTAETYTNTAKRRRVSGNEGLQAEVRHFSRDISILPKRQHNSALPFEEAGNTEYGRVSPTSHVEAHGDLLPILEEMAVSQWPKASSADRANYDDDPTLPSYGSTDL